MTRYYFDIRDGALFCADEDGLELPDLGAVEIEAAASLAEIAKALAPFEENQHIAIEVRTAEGPVFRAALAFELSSTEPTGRA
jgi:hypothetical protein